MQLLSTREYDREVQSNPLTFLCAFSSLCLFAEGKLWVQLGQTPLVRLSASAVVGLSGPFQRMEAPGCCTRIWSGSEFLALARRKAGSAPHTFISRSSANSLPFLLLKMGFGLIFECIDLKLCFIVITLFKKVALRSCKSLRDLWEEVCNQRKLINNQY